MSVQNEIPADFGVETFTVGNQTVRGDVYLMASAVSQAYRETEGKGLLERTEALNVIYHKYGLTGSIGPAGADKLASLIVARGVDLKNEVWATNGPSEPASPATTQG